VDRQLGAPLEHGLLDRAGENALAAEGGGGDVAAPVAVGDHRDQLDRKARPGAAQRGGDQLALGQGEPAAAGRQPQRAWRRVAVVNVNAGLAGGARTA
jgi:hypothetical protein